MKEHDWGIEGGSIATTIVCIAFYFVFKDDFYNLHDFFQSMLPASYCVTALVFAHGLGSSAGHLLYSFTHHRFSDGISRFKDAMFGWFAVSLFTFLICTLLFSSWDGGLLCTLKGIGLCILAICMYLVCKLCDRWQFVCFFHRKAEDYFPYVLPRKREGSFRLSLDEIFESHPVQLNLFVFDQCDSLSIRVDGGLSTREASPLYPVATAVDFLLTAKDCGKAKAAENEGERVCDDDPKEELEPVFERGEEIKTSETRFASGGEEIFSPKMETVLCHTLTCFPELIEIFSIPKKSLFFPHQGKRRIVFKLVVQDKSGNTYASAMEAISLQIR